MSQDKDFEKNKKITTPPAYLVDGSHPELVEAWCCQAGDGLHVVVAHATHLPLAAVGDVATTCELRRRVTL